MYDEQDKRYLDLISSWWVNLHGHAYEYIAEKIYQQALRLEHVIFADYTHEPAIALVKKLDYFLSSSSLTKYFYSDNGSTSTEVALKMAYQYWFNQGFDDKKVFIGFEGGYHGDTVGVMSIELHRSFIKILKNYFSLP